MAGHDETTTARAARVAARIRKLFTKAESVAGTPEAEVLLERAYALLAKYGVDEAEARSSASEGSSEIITYTHTVAGAYQLDQLTLVGAVAGALHCEAVRSRTADDDRVLYVLGARRHVDRVEMLAGVLCGVMLAAAAAQPRMPGVATVSHRKSFMAGFAYEVGRRLAAAERSAVEATEDSTGTDLVLRTDAERAEAALRARFPYVRSGAARRVGRSGIAAGRSEARKVDLGQQRVGGGRRELGA